MTSKLRAQPGRPWRWLVLSSLGFLCLPAMIRADLVQFGNTRYRTTEVQGGLSVTIDGTLNAAVFQRVSDSGDIWGTGNASLSLGDFTPGVSPSSASPGLDTTAQYLYVYQLVNDGGSGQTIGSVGLTAKEATSWGAFNSLSFVDDDGAISKTNSLGTNGGAFDNTFRAGGSSAVSLEGAEPQGIAVNTVELKPDGAGPGFDSFRAVWSINGAVAGNERSALFAFTSNSTPSVAIFSAQGATSVNAPTVGTVTPRQGGGDPGDPGNPGDPGTPNNAPEPSTLALSMLGLSCLGARAWRRFRVS